MLGDFEGIAKRRPKIDTVLPVHRARLPSLVTPPGGELLGSPLRVLLKSQGERGNLTSEPTAAEYRANSVVNLWISSPQSTRSHGMIGTRGLWGSPAAPCLQHVGFDCQFKPLDPDLTLTPHFAVQTCHCRVQRGGRRPLQVSALSISSNDCRPGVTVEVEGAPYRVVGECLDQSKLLGPQSTTAEVAACRTDFLHVKPGKGSAFVRTKLKSYLSGSTIDKTFRAGEQVTQAEVSRLDAQFSYLDGDQVSHCSHRCLYHDPIFALCVRLKCVQYVFMDTASYEEHRLSKEDTWANYITEGSNVQLMAWNDKIISVELPNVVPLKVMHLMHLTAAWLSLVAHVQRSLASFSSADMNADAQINRIDNVKSASQKPATLESGVLCQVRLAWVSSTPRQTAGAYHLSCILCRCPCSSRRERPSRWTPALGSM